MDSDSERSYLGITEEVEDLSDDQIQQLLKNAETRLRAAQSSTDNNNNTLATLPKLDLGDAPPSYIKNIGGIARTDAARLVDENTKDLSNAPRLVTDPLILKKKSEEEKKATAGPEWFNLPRTDLTNTELKRDLQLLKMRGALDPKRFYKREHGKMGAPEYSQVGTIVEGPTEFYSARIQNKDRKRTFVEDVLAGEKERGYFKSRYDDVQVAKTSGKKAHYKAVQQRRKHIKR
ncbi:MAG: hypothetical protein M1834_000253 [Cirrosporium novae-zelandiae]|nr:MAG: hypothetical protein M1834_000253 [Cirrosporium novae-zelandiae]